MDTVTQDSALLYTAQPVTFVRLMIEAGRVDKLQETLIEQRHYPFLSDILLEWLERQPSPSSEVAETVVSQIVHEVIGRMTIDELCSMLDKPFAVLQQDGKLLSQDVANLLKEFRLSALANRFPLNEELTTDDVRRRLLQEESAPALVNTTPDTNYGEFLKELKDAGVIIPSGNGTPSSPKQSSRVKKTPVEEALAAAALKPRTTKPAVPKASATKPETPKVSSPPKAARTKAEPSPRSVETYFSPDAKEKVMSKIFRDDEEDYQRSIALIDRAKDWKQASIYLDALFMRRKVDPYSKTAIRLTDAVYARFHSH